jgi:adenosine kinase
VTGSLAFDTIMDFEGCFSDHILPDQLHKINLSFLATDMQKTNGGTAGNISYNLGLLECKPVLLSMFGKEAGEYREFLFKHGVDVENSPLSQKYFSSQAFILTDKTDNQIASFYPGSMVENQNLRINELMNSRIQGKDKNNLAMEQWNNETIVVISPNAPEAMKGFVNQCVEAKIPYMYDPGMQLPRLSDEDLREGIKNCEILIGNDYEMELMKKRMGGDLKVPILITTLGEKGAVVFDHRKIMNSFDSSQPLVAQDIILPSKADKIIDPTGAGDAFRGGFLAGYIRDFDLITCGQIGAVAAVYTVEKYGTTTHEFTVDEFCKRYKENYGVELKMN